MTSEQTCALHGERQPCSQHRWVRDPDPELPAADQEQAGSNYCRNCDARLTVPESKQLGYCQSCREMPIYAELARAREQIENVQLCADTTIDALKADLERVTAERMKLWMQVGGIVNSALGEHRQYVHVEAIRAALERNRPDAALDATRKVTGEQGEGK